MQQDQLEGNKLIAEFMGLSEDNYPKGIPDWVEIWGKWEYNNDKIKYHSSWDWLMPVVEKILHTWTPEKGAWPYEYIQLAETKLGTSLKIVHERAIAFIKVYNTQNK